jgi:tRNA threonylcarbamoyladenosine biosynthesis protein TsaE
MAEPLAFTSNSAEETLEIGRALGQALAPGDVVGLTGELGAGKTVLTRGIALGLGVREPYIVTSPTFVLMNTYTGRCPIRHFDLYRVEGSELISLGFSDLREDSVSVIEWAEKADPALLGDHVQVEMSHRGENARKLEFTALGSRSARLLESVKLRTLARKR